jgi:hypothetical protein
VAGEWQTSKPVTEILLTVVGAYLVEFYSVDNAGNEEEVRSTTFAIETPVELAPELSLSAQPNVHRVGPNRAKIEHRAEKVDPPAGLVHCRSDPKSENASEDACK